MKNYFGITFLLIAVLFVSCKSDQKTDSATAPVPETKNAPETQDASDRDSPITKLPLELPAEFSELSIPLFKGAKIDGATKHNLETNSRLQIRFTTETAPKEIEKFYLAAMKKMGWKVTNSTKQPTEQGAYFSVYNNGEKQFILNSVVPSYDGAKTVSTMMLMDYGRK